MKNKTQKIKQLKSKQMVNKLNNQFRSISDELIKNNDQEGINILMGIIGSIDTTSENSIQMNGLLKMFGTSSEKPTKTKVVSKPSKSVKNYGFKVTNSVLKSIIDKGKKVSYNPQEHITVRELGYKSNYQLNKIGKKRLENFKKNGGMIFIQKDTKKTKGNQVKYLFSKSKGDILKVGTRKSSVSNPSVVGTGTNLITERKK